MDNFVIEQVKFMYGDYYDQIIDHKFIKINNLIKNVVLVKDCINIEKYTDSRLKDFIMVLNKYWLKKRDDYNYVIKSNWNDVPGCDPVVADSFILTHSRKFNDKKQAIFLLYNYFEPNNINIDDKINFKDKQNKLIWRGSTTGSHIISLNTRYNIISKNFKIHQDIDIGFTNGCQHVYIANKHIIDNYFKNKLSKVEQLSYKFILNIEGNVFSSSFIWALVSNSCPLHNYPFNYETFIFGMGLEPWVHFVPINTDGSDLVEKYNWCLNNLDKCEEIANNGKIYMKNYLDKKLFDAVIYKFFELYPLIID